ncbi:hypothetical protein QFZ74_000342 [Streptomyces sp. V3I7]|nr:hypothetical protein [Streptomyces sp. V3I7]MDQ0989114.1 hypothetical protein [Streptomyces sp. V3I7]
MAASTWAGGGGVLRQPHPDRHVGEQEADEVLHGVLAAGDARDAHDDVARSGLLVQQRYVGGRHRGCHGGAGFGGPVHERGGDILVEDELVLLAGVVGGVGRRIVGQWQPLGGAVEIRTPEGAVFGSLGAGEAVALPLGVVAELHRQVRDLGLGAVEDGPVVLDQFVVEAHIGPLVGERVRHRLDHLVVVVRDPDHREPEHRVVAQVEGAAHLLGDERGAALLHLIVGAVGHIGEGDFGAAVGVHLQVRPAVLRLDAGAQQFMAAGHGVRGRGERVQVEGAAEAEPEAEGVGGGAGVQLVQDPQPFLVHAQREPVAGARPRAQCRARAGGGKPVGERGALGGAQPGQAVGGRGGRCAGGGPARGRVALRHARTPCGSCCSCGSSAVWACVGSGSAERASS